jgi:hypothetical protein
MATAPAPISRPLQPKAKAQLDPRAAHAQLRFVVAAVVLTVLLAAAFGVGAGTLLRYDSAPVATIPQVASSGPIRLELDGGWMAVRPLAALDASGLRDLMAFEPLPRLPGLAWIARAPADSRSLIPAGVRARISGTLPEPEGTTLAGARAWRYAALPLRAGRMLELTVQPTSAGVLVVGCEAPWAWWPTVTGCAGGVLSVAGVRTQPPSADIALRERLPAVIARLNAARAKGGQALTSARTARGQRRAARALAAAHAAAAAKLVPLAAADGAGVAVVVRLKAGAAAYRGLAAAAGRKAPKRYAAARAKVRKTGAALRKALARESG